MCCLASRRHPQQSCEGRHRHDTGMALVMQTTPRTPRTLMPPSNPTINSTRSAHSTIGAPRSRDQNTAGKVAQAGSRQLPKKRNGPSGLSGTYLHLYQSYHHCGWFLSCRNGRFWVFSSGVPFFGTAERQNRQKKNEPRIGLLAENLASRLSLSAQGKIQAASIASLCLPKGRA